MNRESAAKPFRMLVPWTIKKALDVFVFFIVPPRLTILVNTMSLLGKVELCFILIVEVKRAIDGTAPPFSLFYLVLKPAFS